MATVSCGRTPRPASPPALARTRSPYSPHVHEMASPLVRNATSSRRAVTVIWNASHSVAA